ncbi:TPA: DUF551 domain-containing protein [Klebsiella pneumoniae]|nr:DUF551 domain-containing protein [Klebsiella pneumoniae]
MTKSTITREQLLEIIETDHVQCGEASYLARMALAAIDSKPDCNERQLFCSTDTARMKKVISVSAGSESTPLYRHAQQPVVPEEITSASAPEVFEIAAEAERLGLRGTYASYAVGWNACRAAMLAAAPQSPGSEPATVPGKWIPVSERLPEDSGRYWCYVEEQNDLGKSHYQWNCSWNGDRWWVESEGVGIVTHWMPLPAAPQEVNRE